MKSTHLKVTEVEKHWFTANYDLFNKPRLENHGLTHCDNFPSFDSISTTYCRYTNSSESKALKCFHSERIC